MRYVVTGVDGQLGGRVAENMLHEVSGEQLIFTCPDLKRLPKEKVQAWKKQGVTIREANYDNKEQMTEAFRGGDRIFLVSSIINGPKRVQQHKNAIDAAIAAGVKHITYTSFLGANREEYNQYVLPDHTATEKYLRESGVDYNIMRNNLYMENYLINSVILANISDNKWITPAGDGKATFVAKDDSGRVATALLLGKGEHNKDYDVTGGELISEGEICAMIAEASGINYEYVPVNPDEFFKYLDSIHVPRTTDGDYSQSPVPFCGNDMVTNEFSIRDGLMAIETDTIEKLTGRKPLRVRDLIDKYSFVWKERVSSYWDLGKYL
ncbi:NmrA family NAD(P)-binding protein [Calorimonas adulescens]|uniref:NAD(P)H-binding protein n=1 Tax=Calorimonas adulescens TaxID=2606906 RepID=A0A5D8Q940_9THEO|nr:NmrA family NAD(P)-binding protein [Calorimonas adulescens]TZE81012.1 NAD(P)H-binding protein [Calorimonas adulescens]